MLLDRVRAKYDLPQAPFFLMVVKGYARIEYAGRALCPPKNVEGALRAYANVRASTPVCPPLVILGAGVTNRLTPAVLRTFVDPAAVKIPGLGISLVEAGERPATPGGTEARERPAHERSPGGSQR